MAYNKATILEQLYLRGVLLVLFGFELFRFYACVCINCTGGFSVNDKLG
jgi:hypothetical protein